MNEVVVLTPERILEVTEDVLRRFGLAKATVVDVARALDVSHGSVYRHFPSKASLREAVANPLVATLFPKNRAPFSAGAGVKSRPGVRPRGLGRFEPGAWSTLSVKDWSLNDAFAQIPHR